MVSSSCEEAATRLQSRDSLPLPWTKKIKIACRAQDAHHSFSHSLGGGRELFHSPARIWLSPVKWSIEIMLPAKRQWYLQLISPLRKGEFGHMLCTSRLRYNHNSSPGTPASWLHSPIQWNTEKILASPYCSSNAPSVMRETSATSHQQMHFQVK